MAGSILARHRADALAFTSTVTEAQRSVVRMAIDLNPAARAHPEIAAAVAAAHGFSVDDKYTVSGHPALTRRS